MNRLIAVSWYFLLLHIFIALCRAQDAKAPPDLQRLFNLGHVEFKFYDPKAELRERAGNTAFKLNVKWQFDTKFKWKRDGDVQRVTITPTLNKSENELTHLLLIPQEYARSPKFWGTQLVRHEFDHVAISADPRVPRLIDHLCRKITTVEATVPADEKITTKKAAELVNAEYVKRRTAVNDLVKKNYELLDAVSQHGNVAIPNRPAFFVKLYTKPNLEQAEFPYLADVLDLLETREYSMPEESPKPTKKKR